MNQKIEARVTKLGRTGKTQSESELLLDTKNMIFAIVLIKTMMIFAWIFVMYMTLLLSLIKLNRPYHAHMHLDTLTSTVYTRVHP